MPRCYIATLAASAVLATGGAGAHSIEECNSADFATVLNAAPGAMEARGVWMGQRSIAWPGAPAGGVFRLYHAPAGGINAMVGGKVTGAQASLALGLVEGATIAARFRYLDKGPVLSVPASADLAALLR
ncbi:MAG TPA: DUF3372 domain-containing protein, partial [Telluria sp.]|nr:DUF3372 domain-containing protein [Telluria sp.]